MKPIDVHRLKKLPAGLPALPDGWLNGFDAAVLYSVACAVEGPTLEVGSWIGKSSCCIAYAMRDRPRKEVDFDIVDFRIAGVAEWKARFGGNLLAHHDAEALLSVVCFPGGTAALLKKNLVDRGLSQHVRAIFLGDVRDYAAKAPYDFIFCDATHDADEIRRNIPLLVAHLNQDNFVLVCDAIITEENAELVMQLTNAGSGWLTCQSDPHSKFLVCAKGKYNQLF